MRPCRARFPLVPAPGNVRSSALTLLPVLLALLLPVPLAVAFIPLACPASEDPGLWIDRPLLAVEIQGLHRTRPLIVLRELSARAGAPLDWDRLERDRLRLLDLGLFASVAFFPRRDRDLDRPILDVRVRERPDFLAVPTVSWEEGQGFTYGASAATLNLRGMARTAWVAAGTGARRYVQVGCATRWVFGRRLGFSAQSSLRQTRNLSQGSIERHSGVSAGLAPTRGLHLSFPFGAGWEQVRARPDANPAPEFTGTAAPRRDDHRWVEAGARIDTRDYRARPRRGDVLALRVAANGGLLGGSMAMERYALDAMLVRATGTAVLTVASRTVLSRGGVPAFLQMDLGGASDLRGHPPDLYKGDNRWSGWVEERFPLLPRLEIAMPPPFSNTFDLTVDGAVFVDAGAIGSRGDWSRGRVRGRWGAGAGLRLVLPFAGLLSLDLATDGRGIEAHALAGPRF
jgi:outer membrane protein assembly factor BamA